MKLHWGNSIFLFYVAFISAAIFFIVFSLGQNNDLVTDDYYEQGANYSESIEIRERSTIFSDSLIVSCTSGAVFIALTPGLVNATDSLSVLFFRSSDKAKDIQLRTQSADSIMIPKAKFARGKYLVKINWVSQGVDYKLQKDLFIE